MIMNSIEFYENDGDDDDDDDNDDNDDVMK